jgi:CheY-like chemotaxis protein
MLRAKKWCRAPRLQVSHTSWIRTVADLIFLDQGDEMANLLLVDDDLDIADAFADVLRAEGHQVRMARNGEEGLARLAEEKPDLVISDVQMPVLDGPDMAYEIFLRDAGSELIPILLTSGVADLHHVARQVGTPYFLGKPFTVRQLLDKLNQALAERRRPQPKLAAGRRS